jgi:hypothetical protein
MFRWFGIVEGVWWVKDKGGRRQALCLFITKVMGKLYARRLQQEKADSTLGKKAEQRWSEEEG